MKAQQQPTKQQVRDHMAERQKAKTPPKTPDEIRRELGWFLNPANAGVR